MTDEKNLSTFEEGSEDFAAMFAAQEAGTVRLQPGQKVTGTIITITGDSVFVDVGIKLDGIMDRKDILDAEGNESVAPVTASKSMLWVPPLVRSVCPAP